MTDEELKKIISAAAENIKMPNQEKMGEKIENSASVTLTSFKSAVRSFITQNYVASFIQEEDNLKIKFLNGKIFTLSIMENK